MQNFPSLLGLLAIPFLPDPDQVEDAVHKFRNGPLGFIPKPGFGKKHKISEIFNLKKDAAKESFYTTAKPVVYSFDLSETDAERRYKSILTGEGSSGSTTSSNFNFGQGSNFDLGTVPGP